MLGRGQPGEAHLRAPSLWGPEPVCAPSLQLCRVLPGERLLASGTFPLRPLAGEAPAQSLREIPQCSGVQPLPDSAQLCRPEGSVLWHSAQELETADLFYATCPTQPLLHTPPICITHPTRFPLHTPPIYTTHLACLHYTTHLSTLLTPPGLHYTTHLSTL